MFRACIRADIRNQDFCLVFAGSKPGTKEDVQLEFDQSWHHVGMKRRIKDRSESETYTLIHPFVQYLFVLLGICLIQTCQTGC